MKKLVCIVMTFTLAISISAFASSRKADETPKPPHANAAAEAKPAACPDDQQSNQGKACAICQSQPEDSNDKSARQRLIEQQEKEWLKNLDHNN